MTKRRTLVIKDYRYFIELPPQAEEGGDSGEEEESLTRKFIKRQAQMIVEAKARKRNRPVSTFKS